ncbi:transglutaminaseTgpA domain-containing protein [Derxia gummosa]|uniref:TransglutaminaseTgpA domain-containing protein n=1 Tax=Derxia gummosa DSM 723 TaxID=1121388 RepID=A0A8B6X8J6_9BURK|nr:DUF3488 and transglutaminase-like domain-containing protein [Derxia gummosa]
MNRLVRHARRQLALLGHEGRATLMLLLAVATVITPHFGHLPGWALAVALAAFGWKCRLLVGHRAAPHRLLLVIVVGAVVLGTWRSYGSLFGRDAGVTLLVMLMCLKLLEMQARRDSFVIAYLGFFLAATEFLFSQSIPTAATVTVGLVLLFAAMAAGQIGSAEPLAPATMGAGRDAATPPDPAAPTGLRLALAISLRTAAWALPLALALFLLFPRIPGPLWSLPNDAGGAHVGLSDSMSPGDMSDLADSGAMAFRARFDGATPERRALYWRSIVMSHFDGRTWRPTASAPPGNLAATVVASAPEPLRASSAPVGYQLLPEPSGERWLYALDGALALGPGAHVADAGSWQADAPLRERVVLRGSAALDYHLGGPDGPLARRLWLQLPTGYNPRTLDYAARLRADFSDDRALVNAVLSRFRRDAYRYTLHPPRLGRDSVDEFLFQTRAGFCEHYASAFTVLMRAAGIPARVVAGYQGGETNPVDGWVEVRQSDAHAWAEIWLGADAGWVRVDPTAAVAPERVERGLMSALPEPVGLDRFVRFAGNGQGLRWMRDLRHRWNAIENAWNLAVLHYDHEQQAGLFERLGFGKPDLQRLLLACMAALGLASAALAASALWQAARRPRPDRLTRLAHHFEQRLAGAGCVREPHEPPQAFARRAIAWLAEADADHAAIAPRATDAGGHAAGATRPARGAGGPTGKPVPAPAEQARRIFEAIVAMRYRRPPTPAELEVLQRWIAEFKPRSPR